MSELEEKRERALEGFNQNLLPESCSKWMKKSSLTSSAFVTLFNTDFKPKIQQELAELADTQVESLKALKEAQKLCKEPASIILKNLNELHDHFKKKQQQQKKQQNSKSQKQQTKQSLNDPWLNELTIRHFSSKFLDEKSVHLQILLKNYIQIRNLNSQLSHKLKSFTEEFFLILERFGLENSGDRDQSDNLSIDHYKESSADKWISILKEYSLDYDWNLSCPPLDGFLSSLYNNLKSLGIDLKISISNNSIPKIFLEKDLRFGFLQKSISGLISKSWQIYFSILQPATGFLHLFKVNKNVGSEGNLLVPSAGQEYSKSSLQDLNILATQFYLQNDHQPSSISDQTLNPFLSIHLTKDSKIVASDPENFSFIIKLVGGDKFTFKAFCEEEFVDWVIFLNEASGKTNQDKDNTDTTQNTDSIHNVDSTANISPELTQKQTQAPDLDYTTNIHQSSITLTESSTNSIAHIVEIENPWS